MGGGGTSWHPGTGEPITYRGVTLKRPHVFYTRTASVIGCALWLWVFSNLRAEYWPFLKGEIFGKPKNPHSSSHH
ncbi:hypothetical protein QOT17_007648 [Balamuthia mandrillaris]